MSTIVIVVSMILLLVVSDSIPPKQTMQDSLNSEDVALEKSLETRPRTYLADNGYQDHFLACRANEPKRVDAIIEAIKGKDVVLYFHGGLSNQKYVVTELGPWLMKSVFDQEPIKQQLYPIFVNYDAGIWDWDIYSSKIQKVAKSKTYLNFLSSMKQSFGLDDSRLLAVEGQADVARNAAELLFKFDKEKNGKTLGGMSEDEQTRYFVDILQATQLPSQFVGENRSLRSELDGLAESFSKIDLEYAETNEEKSQIRREFVGTAGGALRVVRILARMALGSDHGLGATIAEEVFDALQISTLGQAHWTKVRTHSRECFAEGSNGRNLIERLILLQKESGQKIHTWSHSAGSIPTAELINYLGKNPVNKGVLNQVQMVVPAISQKEFNALVQPNQNVFTHLQVYALAQEFERDDHLIKVAYPASLLYAVSSLADRTIHMDRMLIIDQHMQSGRRPYNSDTYQIFTGENPKILWDSMLKGQGSNTALYIYPKNTDTTHVRCEPCNTKCGPSHEGTKFPWLSTDLTRQILSRIGIPNSQALFFPDTSK